MTCLQKNVANNGSKDMINIAAAHHCAAGELTGLTLRCAHFILAWYFSGNFFSSPSRRKLMRPPRGAMMPKMKVASPNFACTDLKCSLPCTVCKHNCLSFFKGVSKGGFCTFRTKRGGLCTIRTNRAPQKLQVHVSFRNAGGVLAGT